jgi:hypothetical protein
MATDNGKWIRGTGSYTEYRYRKYNDKPYVENQHDNTSFIRKWGIHATELAKQEGVSTEAIHMRVQNYGTPFQRKAKPTLCEKLHHKTDYELGMELNLHPQSIRRKVAKFNNAYYENPYADHPLRGQVISTKHDWRTEVKKTKFWLHPEHPDYPHAYRKGL